MLHHICWFCWVGGALLVAASHFDVVSPELGWAGFYVTLGAVVVSYLPTRRASAPAKAEDWAILTKAMVQAKDHSYDSAINRLQMGDTVFYDGLAFAIRKGDIVRLATVASLPAKEMDEIRALRDADNARAAFETLARSAPEIAVLVADKQVQVSLLSEFGGNNYEVCRTVDGQIEWQIKR
jgi:hypothetical protein